MTFALLAGDTLEFAHVGRIDGLPDESEIINSGHFSVALVVLDKNLNIKN